MTMRFDGRVAVITGAGRGLGRSYALLLASLGCKVVVNDNGSAIVGEGADSGPAQQVVDEIAAAGGEAIANTDSVATPEGAAAIVQATGQTIDLSLRILDAGARTLQIQQGPGPLRAGFPPGAAYAVAENGPHRVIRPLPAAFLPDDPRLGKPAYKVALETPKTADFLLSHAFTATAEGVVVGLCLEPNAEFAWVDDGMVDLLPGERHTFRGRIPRGCRDWREAFRARSWHDLRGQ